MSIYDFGEREIYQPTIMDKIFGTLGKIPKILKPQVIFFLQLRR